MSRGLTLDHESSRDANVPWATDEDAQARSSRIDGVEVDEKSDPGILMDPVLSQRGRRTMCFTTRMPPGATSEEAAWT
jgi:hypothetical protein